MKREVVRKGFILIILSIPVLFALSSCSKPQPTRAWTEQTGSPADDFAYSVVVDGGGNTYVAGSTAGGLDGQPNAGYRDIYLAKYDAGGEKLWSRQAGSSSWEEAYSIAVDSKGNIYTAGYTFGSLDGQPNAGIYDAFLMKFDTEGSKLWTQQMGTSEHDYAYSVAVDGDGNTYVAGYTYGDIGGTGKAGGADIFLMKFDTEGNKLWTQQMGTPSDDIAYSVAVDSAGNSFVSGYTGGGLDGNTYSGSWDVFLVKYDPEGKKLWTKQSGTASWDEAWAVVVDSGGNAYVTGYTGGGLQGQKSEGAFDIFLAKYDPTGTHLWTKQVGSVEHDYAHAVSIDPAGNAYVAGYTDGKLGSAVMGGADLFLLKFDPNGKKLWAHQLGTGSADYSFGLTVDSAGAAYIAGETSGAFQGKSNAGGYDLFTLKVNAPPQETSLWGRFAQLCRELLKKLGIGA